MLIIKITKIFLNPVYKTERSFNVEDKTFLDEKLIEELTCECTEKEDINTLIKKFNLGVRRFNKGTTDSIILYTHPEPGVVARLIIEIYEKIGKEIGKLL